jgi:hypothetical protein
VEIDWVRILLVKENLKEESNLSYDLNYDFLFIAIFNIYKYIVCWDLIQVVYKRIF